MFSVLKCLKLFAALVGLWARVEGCSPGRWAMTPACRGIVTSPLHHDRGVLSVRSLFFAECTQLAKTYPCKVCFSGFSPNIGARQQFSLHLISRKAEL